MNQNQMNKTSAGTDIQQVRKQNAQSAQGTYATEFASETNVQEVKQQNAQSAQAKSGSQSYLTEFAPETATNVQEVKQQNAQAESRKSQNVKP
ncbi:gamma-type small acid-soluble spore protein [Ectobacillus polymachus]|uniref:gamma-type small acid-soluble spore protein n=1 Tax=Ectobacillus polymachus TaxID=1508806 RepID=UPI003A836A7B